MYHYIVDSTHISPRHFDRSLSEVHGFLTQFQIGGDIQRVTRLKSIPELANSALSAGAKTIVVVGSDESFLEAVRHLADQEQIVVGYIPLNPSSEIATVLGVGGLEEACRNLAQRRIENFTLGKINSLYFFHKVEFGPISQLGTSANFGSMKKIALAQKLASLSPLPVSITIDGNFKVKMPVIAGLALNAAMPSTLGSYHSDHLDLFLVEPMPRKLILKYRHAIFSGRFADLPNVTVLHGQKITIDGLGSTSLKLDSLATIKPPVDLALAQNPLKVIVGRQRTIQ